MNEVSMVTSSIVVCYAIKLANDMSIKTSFSILLGVVLLGIGSFIDILDRLGYPTPLICGGDTSMVMAYMGIILILWGNRRRYYCVK